MFKPLALAVCLAASLGACGSQDQPTAAVPARVEAVPAPAAATAAGTLAGIPDSDQARRRVGYVNAGLLADLGGPVPAAEIQRMVLGATGSKRLDAATGTSKLAVQVGDATVLHTPKRSVVGGSSAVRSSLHDTDFEVNVITDEAQSAVQACLGDSAAQLILGPEVSGEWAAIGAGVVNTADVPAGPKLRLCAAPHWVRAVHRLEKVFGEMFPATGDPATRPIVTEVEIGEREMVGATVPLERVDRADLRDFLRGGPKLVSLIKS